MGSAHKARVTLMLDLDVIEALRAKANARGLRYAALINESLRAAISRNDSPLTAKVLREVLREELARVRIADEWTV